MLICSLKASAYFFFHPKFFNSCDSCDFLKQCPGLASASAQTGVSVSSALEFAFLKFSWNENEAIIKSTQPHADGKLGGKVLQVISGASEQNSIAASS